MESQEVVDVNYLRTFQSAVMQRQALINECKNTYNCIYIVNKKKQDLLEKIDKQNKECYKHKLNLLYCYDHLYALAFNKRKPVRRLLCINEKEFLGSAHIFLMRILLMLRENKEAFQCFLEMIQKEPKIPYTLADDLIFMLFADFTSSENNTITILRHLEGLIQVLINYLRIKNIYF